MPRNPPTFTALDHAMMAEALRLARKGLWTAEPNPRVGCVIVRGDRIVGRGWHSLTGGPHAESVALAGAGAEARGATAYINLEPCSHHGRTPPCADALIAAGIARVVCAMRDPHPSVAGEGMRRLEAAGVEVVCGLMSGLAHELNRGFVSRIERKRPFVRAKLAGSLDAKTSGPDGASKWITSEAARRDGHRWRARAGAILTGIETVLADDPAMDVRLADFKKKPLVVVADSRARLPVTARLLSTGAPVLQACVQGDAAVPAAWERVILSAGPDGRVALDALFGLLAQRGINELHVEAGPALTGALLMQGLIDELLVYQAPCIIGMNGGAMVRLPGVEKLDQRLHFQVLERRVVGPDLRLRLAPEVSGR
ncbi:MAG TPA: bifunctional diaminohydroxyphosphoribosylaminopyrimidine deaminase/5-amino-6-(5-phosphoribosylamino)uracil reductase RibD [Wenzhouxiangellaceae bacterium]|nr:bifunctional diaminohydroxyphosphoribosylaminopyrimidine deaminase/5-amino-6-(5-phosphoribosylamino)uracil reductase RibD [Wenzhouxiangellaceae bacterium]